MSRLHSLLFLAGALALGLLVGPFFAPAPKTDQVTRSSWKDIYDSPQALLKGVDAVALVHLIGSEPGRIAPGDNGGSPVAYLLDHFAVDQAVKGTIAPGDSVTVEQTAEQHDDGSVVGIDSDGGPYDLGKQYLVFLKKQPGTDRYYVVSFQGRYNIENERLVGVHADDPVVTKLQSKRLADVMQTLTTWTDRGDMMGTGN
jgi:hypothetical protein